MKSSAEGRHLCVSNKSVGRVFQVCHKYCPSAGITYISLWGPGLYMVASVISRKHGMAKRKKTRGMALLLKTLMQGD